MKITLRINVNVADPEWTVDDATAMTLRTSIRAALSKPHPERFAGEFVDGYHGLTVDDGDSSQTIFDLPAATAPDERFGVDAQILNTAPPGFLAALDLAGDELFRPYKTGNGWPISGIGTMPAANPTCGPSGMTFAGEKATWNDPSNIGNNNCYRYARHCLNKGPKDPAGKSNKFNWNSSSLRAAAIGDGLIDQGTTLPTACPSGDGHIMALCYRSGGDYHCLRLDRDGNWSNKEGGRAATTKDGMSHVIGQHLASARFGRKMSLVGFFFVPDGLC